MKASRDFAAVLADERANLIVFACSEPLKPNRLVRFAGRRFRVKDAITKEQFDAARARNAEIRKKYGRPNAPHQFSVKGATAENLEVIGHPPEVPQETAHFYVWAEEL